MMLLRSFKEQKIRIIPKFAYNSKDYRMGQQRTEINNSWPMSEINPETTSKHAMRDHENFYENPGNIVEMQTITIHNFQMRIFLMPTLLLCVCLKMVSWRYGVGRGLIMDCLTDFWNTFYLSRTFGTTYKIPTLHHACQERERKPVAHILVFGWQRFKYLPNQLAPPFLYEALCLTSQTYSLIEAF